MESESPEVTMMEVAAIVAGAGAAGTIQGLVKSVLPQVGAEIGGAVAGGLLFYFGDRVHPLVKVFGVGVLAGSLAPLIARAIPKVGGKSSSSSPEVSTSEEAAKAKYGWT